MTVPYDFAKDGMKEVAGPGDYPSGISFVIQFFEKHSVHHEGDERSRLSPGHGYPAYTETFLVTRTFVTPDPLEWRRQIEMLHILDKNRTDMAVFEMRKANIKTRVEVEIE